MVRGDLRLNDFEGFERFLFTDEEMKKSEEEKWKKYYQDRMFITPIDFPKQIEEHQLFHYAYWMVISVFGLRTKPFIKGTTYADRRCYACNYVNALGSHKCTECPITIWRNSVHGNGGGCLNGESYYRTWEWSEDSAPYAKKIAHLEWSRPQ